MCLLQPGFWRREMARRLCWSKAAWKSVEVARKSGGDTAVAANPVLSRP